MPRHLISGQQTLRAQAAGEAVVREAFPSATIVRPAVLVGVEDRLFNSYARLAKLLPVLLPDGGAGKLQPVFVRDVAAAIVESLKDRATLGKDIELAGPAVFTCALNRVFL